MVASSPLVDTTAMGIGIDDIKMLTTNDQIKTLVAKWLQQIINLRTMAPVYALFQAKQESSGLGKVRQRVQVV